MGALTQLLIFGVPVLVALVAYLLPGARVLRSIAGALCILAAGFLTFLMLNRDSDEVMRILGMVVLLAGMIIAVRPERRPGPAAGQPAQPAPQPYAQQGYSPQPQPYQQQPPTSPHQQQPPQGPAQQQQAQQQQHIQTPPSLQQTPSRQQSPQRQPTAQQPGSGQPGSGG